MTESTAGRVLRGVSGELPPNRTFIDIYRDYHPDEKLPDDTEEHFVDCDDCRDDIYLTALNQTRDYYKVIAIYNFLYGRISQKRGSRPFLH